jgi:ribonuclease Z
MQHGAPCLAYSFKEKDKIRIDKKKLEKLKLPNSPLIHQLQQGKDIEFQGKKIKAKDITYEEKGKKITFILDTGINKEMLKASENADLLICESTFLDDSDEGKELARDYKHLTAKQSAETAKQADCKKLILTHLSQRYENKEKLILAEAKKIFKDTIIAEDLMRFKV